jgi:rhodanese-related sulfurtransferase
MAVKSIQPQELAKLMEQKPDLCLLDVRTPAEYQTLRAAGARSMPLSELQPKRLIGEIGKATDAVYLICKSGGRSMKAAEMFVRDGFENVVNVSGGTDAWAAAGLPVERAGRKVLPLDRQVQTAAGLLCLTGVILGTWVHPLGFLLSALVGCGLTMAGLTGFCPMALLLARMPWNKAGGCSCSSGGCCSSKK